MKKLLLTFALAGVVSAGATYRACGYCALAYNPATGKIGMMSNCYTLEEAKQKHYRHALVAVLSMLAVTGISMRSITGETVWSYRYLLGAGQYP